MSTKVKAVVTANKTKSQRASAAGTQPPKRYTPPASVAKQAPKATVDAIETVESRNILRKRELVNAVVQRSGVKKKDAKPVVEALLAELGESLALGREFALPPLGRMKINREKELPNGKVLVLKLRQKKVQSGNVIKSSASD